MRFADEVTDPDDLRSDLFEEKPGKPEKRELDMAKALIDSMTEKWNPEAYKDEYREALEQMIEDKIEHGDKAPPKTPAPKKRPSNVIDLVEVLQQSMRDNAKKPKKGAARKSASHKATARKSASKKRSPSRKAA
jgi:DNA end-binding protein Ku